MSPKLPQSQTLRRLATLAALTLPSLPAQAAVDGDLSSRRMVLTLPAREVSVARVAGVEVRSITVPVPQAMILHRFGGELDGAPLGWSAAVIISPPRPDRPHESRLAQLRHDRPMIELPRPYGIRLEVGDSITVQALVPSGAGRDAELRISIDYEAFGVSNTRLAVVAVRPDLQLNRTGLLVDSAAGAWYWTPDVDGRLVAISGRQLSGAEELVVEDVITGETLWRTRATFPPSPNASKREVIRPGIVLQAGRTYRLRIITPTRVEVRLGRDDEPMIIVLPPRDATPPV